jgi:putative phage-type endonuclease
MQTYQETDKRIIFIPVEQNTPEWQELRKNKIGASDAPIIMGVSPWSTMFQLWQEKLGLRKGIPCNRAMQLGKIQEEKARIEFQEITGIIVRPKVVQHPDYEFMISSLDGIDCACENIVEIKCSGKEDHKLALEGKVSEKYYPQLQHQLSCTSLQKIYYFSRYFGDDNYFGERDNKVVFTQAVDNSYIKNMIDEEIKFWDCVESLDAPKLVDKDYIQRNDREWTDLSASWIECNKQLDLYKQEEERLREGLIELSGKTNCRGAGITLSRVIRKGNVDYKAIPELKTVNLDAYRKQSIEMWRLTTSK